jgi:hypothetical protein
MKKQNGADQTCAISWPEIELEMGFSTASTFELTGRRRRSGGMMGYASLR